jgi:hypothetical protein
VDYFCKFKTEKILSEKFIKDLHKKCMVMFGSGQVNSEKQTKNIGIKWTQVTG